MNRSRLLEAVVGNRCLILILAVALAVRLVLAVAVQTQVDRPPARLCLISGDAEGYWELAQKIISGKDYAIHQPPRYVLRAPGFPLILALSQLLFGPSVLLARCVLACIGTAACGLTYWLGRELADETVGLLAALYTALSPTLALFSVLILSETTFAAAILLSSIAIAHLIRCGSPDPAETADRKVSSSSYYAVTSLIAGFLIGLATMVRPTWHYVGFAIAVVAIASQYSRISLRNCGLSLAAIACGTGLTMAPWTIRNYEVTGHFVPTTLWAGASLYDGLNPTATGDSDMQFFDDDKLDSQMSEYEVDREYSRRAWSYAAQNPGRVLWLAVQKQQRYWSLLPNAQQFQDWRLKLVVAGAALPLLLLAVYGLWISRRDFALIALTAGPLLLFAALHLLFVGSLRYRLPAEYPLAVLAAIGLKALLVRPLTAGGAPS